MATQALFAPKEELRTWNVTLWISQFALAWLFGVVGVMRAFFPLEQLEQRLVWADPSNDWLLRGTGYALLAVALALVVPGLTGIATRLVPATALLMAVVMVIAAASHVVRQQPVMLLVDAVIAIGCGFVAWGRARKAP